ncbi:MAG: transposase [bacterium]
MSTRFVNIDRETPMLLPVDLREWVSEDHPVHFVLEAVSQLPLHVFKVNVRGTGSEQYPPAMMLALLIYCYLTGRFASREIEAAAQSDVAVRFLCGNRPGPDHDTICTFRRENAAAFSELFTRVLGMAREMRVLKPRGGVSVDGTKMPANASKHAAVSYGRAQQMLAELEQEVQELMGRAEAADLEDRGPALDIPAELKRRQDRIGRLREAREVIEERFEERKREREAEYEAKLAAHEEKKASGKKPGRPPQPPPAAPKPSDQYNFTDPESRIMKAGNGEHFEQAYNAQAVVDTAGSMLILGACVTDHANDKQELAPTVARVDPAVREVTEVLADSGFFSEAQVQEVERDGGPTVYAAVGRTHHHRTLEDLVPPPDLPPPAPGAPMVEIMRWRLATELGRALYKLRKQTVEPVFGIIKEVMGFRRFLLRGRARVSLEWTLVTTAYNLKRLFRLRPRAGMAVAAAAAV